MGTIVAAGIGKYYKRYTNRWWRLAEWLERGLVHHEKHWVLRDVNFEIRAGESVGIIGHNGAGKSTLLKIITGTTQPSAGSVQMSGRVAALLELGMGFHPEFTGRQNAFMSGQLLGFSNEEIAERMGDIEAFAEIGDYIDQPVRTYSSGMQVRLAFSVATAIRPDILIVDEALSVGDIFFQQKCFTRIQDFAAQGTTLLFVTHSMGTIINLCNRAVFLKSGAVEFDGDPKAAVDLYQADLLRRIDREPQRLTVAPAPAADTVSVVETPAQAPVLDAQPEAGSITTAAVDFLEAQLLVANRPTTIATTGEDVELVLSYRVNASICDPHVGFKIRDRYGAVLYETNTYCLRQSIGTVAACRRMDFGFAFEMRLAPGDYTITVGFADSGYAEGSFERVLNYEHGILAFQVVADTGGMRWSGMVDLAPTFRLRS